MDKESQDDSSEVVEHDDTGQGAEQPVEQAPETAPQETAEQEPENPFGLSDEAYLAMELPEDPERAPDDDNSSAEFEPETAPADDKSAKPAEEPETGEPGSDDESNAPETAEAEKPAERDIAAEHARIFAPFKANGQDIQLESVEEAISLMQQGTNYHKKMEQISSKMKVIKTLEKAGIDGEQLNYLIDLHNKNPAAINKLIADSEIDPMDLDTDADNNEKYRPKDYAPSDVDLELENVLEELKSTPTYSQLIGVVGDQWDDTSRETVANNSHLLKTINTHMARGVYPIIEKELGRQRALGQLRGVSDLAAYQQVGEAINARGGFSHLSTQEPAIAPVQAPVTTPAQAAIALRPAQGSRDQNLDAKRRAASPTKAAATGKTTTNKVNPLGMSDADFERQMGSILS